MIVVMQVNRTMNMSREERDNPCSLPTRSERSEGKGGALARLCIFIITAEFCNRG